ncbi:MAG: aquaporin family protein [Candidatus Omnitrophica bacterium]|nr:aquaporin family protein [Candidatus Omnitrophota bacterium]
MERLQRWHDFIGEVIGTGILVTFGCGAVAVSILYGAHTGLFQVAMTWGFAVTLAVYATRHLSYAHINPAVSVAMVCAGRMPARKLPEYLCGQFTGAFLAACVLYLVFSPVIGQYEHLHGIIRGEAASYETARMFGEFYRSPVPAAGQGIVLSTFAAFLAEAVGTFFLVFIVFSLTEGCNVGRPHDAMAPLFIGITVAMIICIIAPLTQAGINPARDLAPRLFAYLAGWRGAAWPDKHYGALTVYVLGPLCGAAAAALLFTRVVEPLMIHKQRNSGVCA